MADKRPALLSEPWFQRRYLQHRYKVTNTGPAIDAQSPPTYGHVALKCKKLQLEKERQTRIQDDNFQLLTRLSRIMNRKPVPSVPNSAQPRRSQYIRLPALPPATITPSRQTRTPTPLTPIGHKTSTDCVPNEIQLACESLESLHPVPASLAMVMTPTSRTKHQLRSAVSQPCVPSASQHTPFCGCKGRRSSELEDWEAWKSRLLSPPPPPLPSPSPPPVLYPAVILLQNGGVPYEPDTASSTP